MPATETTEDSEKSGRATEPMAEHIPESNNA